MRPRSTEAEPRTPDTAGAESATASRDEASQVPWGAVSLEIAECDERGRPIEVPSWLRSRARIAKAIEQHETREEKRQLALIAEGKRR